MIANPLLLLFFIICSTLAVERFVDFSATSSPDATCSVSACASLSMALAQQQNGDIITITSSQARIVQESNLQINASLTLQGANSALQVIQVNNTGVPFFLIRTGVTLVATNLAFVNTTATIFQLVTGSPLLPTATNISLVNVQFLQATGTAMILSQQQANVTNALHVNMQRVASIGNSISTVPLFKMASNVPSTLTVVDSQFSMQLRVFEVACMNSSYLRTSADTSGGSGIASMKFFGCVSSKSTSMSSTTLFQTCTMRNVRSISFEYDQSSNLMPSFATFDDCRFDPSTGRSIFGSGQSKLSVKISNTFTTAPFEFFDTSSIDLANCTFRGTSTLALPITASSSHPGTSLTVTNSSFTDSIGGAISFKTKGSLTVSQSTFKANRRSFFGGNAIYVSLAVSDTMISIADSNFTDHEYSSNGAALFIKCKDLKINRCNFERNAADGNNGGVLYDACETSSVQNSVFRNNRAKEGGAIYSRGFDQSFLIQLPYQRKYQKNVFEQNTAEHNGGAIFSNTRATLMTISDSTFGNNSAMSGGAVYASGSVEIYSNQFVANRATGTANGDGGALRIEQGDNFIGKNMYLQNSATAMGGAIFAKDFDSYSVYYYDEEYAENFVQNKAADGGALAIISTKRDSTEKTSMYLYRCKFDSNLASGSGGALYVLNVELVYELSDFFNNSATRGGAINFAQAYLSLQQSTLFRNNRATYGGAVYGDLLYLSNTAPVPLFTNNFAQLSGGSVYISALPPSIPTAVLYAKRGNFSNSLTSGYGNVTASLPNEILLKKFTKWAVGIGTLGLNASRNFTVFIGQKFDLTMGLLDIFNNTVQKVDGITFSAFLKPGQPNVLSGPLDQAIAVATGEALMKGLIIQGKYGDDVTLFVKTSIPSIKPLQLQILLKECEPGYRRKFDNSTSLFTCSECDNSYTIKPNAEECNPCPSNAACTLNKVDAFSGYWAHFNNESGLVNTFYCPSGSSRCDVKNGCFKNRDPTSPLCGACLPGFSEWNGSCIRMFISQVTNFLLVCDAAVSAGYLILYLLFLYALFLNTHMSSLSPKLGAAKVLFFFTQQVTLLLDRNQWLIVLNALFDFDFPFSGGDGGNSKLPTPCPFARDGYGKLLTIVIQPLLLFFFLLVTFLFFHTIKLICTCGRCCKKQPKAKDDVVVDQQVQVVQTGDVELQKSEPQSVQQVNETKEASEATTDASATSPTIDDSKNVASKQPTSLKDRILHALLNSKLPIYFIRTETYIASLSYILLITYQQLSKAGFAYFSCKQFGDKYHMLLSTDIQCFTPQHLSWLALYGSLVVYAFCFPFAIMVFLVVMKRLNKMESKHFETRFGVFYLTYKPEYYWYECVQMLRRTVLIFCAALIDILALSDLILIALVLFGFLIMQRMVRPFKNEVDNKLEELSLVSLIVIIFISSVTSRIAYVVLATGVICLFVILVLRYLWMNYVFRKTVKFFMRTIASCCCKSCITKKSENDKINKE